MTRDWAGKWSYISKEPDKAPTQKKTRIRESTDRRQSRSFTDTQIQETQDKIQRNYEEKNEQEGNITVGLENRWIEYRAETSPRLLRGAIDRSRTRMPERMAERPRRILSDRGRKAESEQRTSPNLHKWRRRRRRNAIARNRRGWDWWARARKRAFYSYGCERGCYDPNGEELIWDAAISVQSIHYKPCWRDDVTANRVLFIEPRDKGAHRVGTYHYFRYGIYRFWTITTPSHQCYFSMYTVNWIHPFSIAEI